MRQRRLPLFVFVCAGAAVLLGISTRQRFSASLLIGKWKSEPYSTQLGRATNTFCFSADGKYSSNFISQGGTADDDGDYKVDGRSLFLTGHTGPIAVYTISALSRQRLVLVEDGERRIYHRVSRKCERK